MDSSETSLHAHALSNWLGAGAINIFGMPFAGKDTQAQRIADLLQAPVIAGGDILRSHHETEKITQLMQTGELFPTDYYFEIILPYLSKQEFTGKPLVLSSVGRWHGEEETILNATNKAGHPVKAVVFLNLTNDELWQRFEASQDQRDRGKRHDDAKHIIEVRLEEFREKTLPVIDFYKQNNLLIEIDGHGEPNEVTDRMVRALAEYAKVHP